MARPKVHGSNAEKQKAYRQRKSASKPKETHGVRFRRKLFEMVLLAENFLDPDEVEASVDMFHTFLRLRSLAIEQNNKRREAMFTWTYANLHEGESFLYMTLADEIAALKRKREERKKKTDQSATQANEPAEPTDTSPEKNGEVVDQLFRLIGAKSPKE